jgi:hypothetical protein
MSRNYLGTNPASAFIELDRVDDALVKTVSERKGISEAEATSWIGARAEISPNEWMPVLLFVVPDFETSHVSTVAPEAGAYPPSSQTLLVEREVLPMLDLNPSVIRSRSKRRTARSRKSKFRGRCMTLRWRLRGRNKRCMDTSRLGH